MRNRNQRLLRTIILEANVFPLIILLFMKLLLCNLHNLVSSAHANMNLKGETNFIFRQYLSFDISNANLDPLSW